MTLLPMNRKLKTKIQQICNNFRLVPILFLKTPMIYKYIFIEPKRFPKLKFPSDLETTLRFWAFKTSKIIRLHWHSQKPLDYIVNMTTQLVKTDWRQRSTKCRFESILFSQLKTICIFTKQNYLPNSSWYGTTPCLALKTAFQRFWNLCAET